jgi:hypothetical protein
VEGSFEHGNEPSECWEILVSDSQEGLSSMDLGSSLPRHDDVWGSDGIAPPFLTSALDGRWSVSRPFCVNSVEKNAGTHCTGGRMGARAGMYAIY